MASEMVIEKSVVINKSRQEVFDYIKIARNMDFYSVWNMADPEKKTSYSGTDGTVGFTYRWDSKNKNVGAGEQEIVKISEGTSIAYELRFERPMKNTGSSKFILSDAGNGQTKVLWDFRGPMKFPMSLFKGMFQKMLGKDIEKSLGNLKEVLEKD